MTLRLNVMEIELRSVAGFSAMKSRTSTDALSEMIVVLGGNAVDSSSVTKFLREPSFGEVSRSRERLEEAKSLMRQF
jgi:hypothetical protein